MAEFAPDANLNVANFDPFESGAVALDEPPSQPVFDPFAAGAIEEPSAPAFFQNPPADELGIGEEVRGFGRALNRGGRGFIQSLDVTAMRQAEPPPELKPSKSLADAQRDYEAFNTETPQAGANLSNRDSERFQLGMVVVKARHAEYLKDRAERASKSFAKQAAAIEKLPQTEAQQEFAKKETPWWAFFKNPVELSALTLAESAPQMAATMTAAPAGPMGVAGVAGLASWNAESSGRIINSIAEDGVDLKDPKAVLGWFGDRAKRNPAVAKADLAALGPAAFDTLTAGLAGSFLGPAIGKGLRPVLTATGKEMGLQMAGGGLGSIAGSTLAGEPIDWKDFVLEVAGEFAPGEAISNVRAARRASGAAPAFFQPAFTPPIEPPTTPEEQNDAQAPPRQPQQAAPTQTAVQSASGNAAAAQSPALTPPAIEPEVARQKLWQNMQGREMDIPAAQWLQPASPHLKLVLGATAPSWRDLNFSGVVTANPNPDGSYRVKVIPRTPEQATPSAEPRTVTATEQPTNIPVSVGPNAPPPPVNPVVKESLTTEPVRAKNAQTEPSSVPSQKQPWEMTKAEAGEQVESRPEVRNSLVLDDGKTVVGKAADDHGTMVARLQDNGALPEQNPIRNEQRSWTWIGDNKTQNTITIQDVQQANGDFHKAWILKAIREGKSVPPEVLADYPDIRPAAPTTSAKPKPEELAVETPALSPAATKEPAITATQVGPKVERRYVIFSNGERIGYGKGGSKAEAISNWKSQAKAQAPPVTEPAPKPAAPPPPPKKPTQAPPVAPVEDQSELQRQLREELDKQPVTVAQYKSAMPAMEAARAKRERDNPGFEALRSELGNIGYSVELTDNPSIPLGFRQIGENNRVVELSELPANAVEEVDKWLTQQGSSGVLDTAITKIEDLEKRIRGSGENLGTGIPQQVLLIALQVARNTLQATRSIAKAIDAAIAKIRESIATFDEKEVRDALYQELATDAVNDETKKQQTFGSDIGEEQDIENVKAIQVALVENGYGIGDTVTPENTKKAWEQFASFVDPTKRADTVAQLQAAVPQEMAPGIVHSMLWIYAVRMAATGDASLFRQMAANSNQFILWDGPAFRSTMGRGLRALGVGADFTTWKNERIRSEAQRKLIANDLGIKPDDISLIDLLIQNLNGAKPDADAVVDAVGSSKLPSGETVADVLDKKRKPKSPTQSDQEIDDEVGAEQAEASNRTAAEILRRLQLDYAGVEWLKPGSKPLGIIQQILRDHYKGSEPILPILGNTNRVIDALAKRFTDEAGVSPDIAQQLANAAEVKRQTDWTNARARAINRAKNSGDLRGLIDEILATPYLAQANPAWVRETAENWFMTNGLSREQAQGAAALFQSEFNEKLLAAQTKVAERLLAKTPPNNLRDFIQALRAGLLDPDKSWADVFAEKSGWRTPARAQFQRLAELELKLHGQDLSASERAETIEAMGAIYLHLKLPPSFMQRIAANFVVTALTGIRTVTVNFFAPLERLVTETTFRTVTRPQDFRRNIQTLWSAYAKNWASFKRLGFSLHKDAFTIINNEFDQANNEHRRLWEEAEDDFASGNKVRQAKAFVKGLYGSQQFAMRMLNAADQANAIAEREVQLLNYGSAMFREAGLGTQAVTALVQAASRIKQAAYETAIDRGRSPAQAQVDADEITIEQLEDFISGELRKAGDPDADTKARQAVDAATKDAYSAIGRLAPGVKEEDEGGIISRAVYHNIIKLSSYLRGGKGADPILGVSLLGYVSIPFRTGRFIAWNGPVGLLNMGIHAFRKNQRWDNWWKQSLANEYQERHRLKMALAGTAAWTTASALGFALLGLSGDDDAGDDEFGIYVTGKGPKNKNLRDQWQKSGFRENSIVAFVGGKPMPAIPLTRVGESLGHIAWLLSARDDYGWRKREAEAAGKEFKETWNATTGRAIGNFLGVVGQRGLLQNIAQWAKIGSGEGGSDRVMADLASKTAAGAVLPWLGMQRSLLGMTEGPLDRSSIESAMAANFGIPGLYWNKQAVNRFGDPLGNRTWFGKIGDTGAPLAFQVAETSENQKFYRALAQKGAAPPELRRYVLEEKYGPLTDDQFTDFAKKSGALLKQSAMSKLSDLQQATPAEVKSFLSKAASQADKTAAAALGLQPLTKPETEASAAGASLRAATSAATAGASAAVPALRRPSSGSLRASLSRRIRTPALGRVRSRLGRTRLATMRVPRLRRSRLRASLSRPRRGRFSVRSRMARARRPRVRYA